MNEKPLKVMFRKPIHYDNIFRLHSGLWTNSERLFIIPVPVYTLGGVAIQHFPVASIFHPSFLLPDLLFSSWMKIYPIYMLNLFSLHPPGLKDSSDIIIHHLFLTLHVYTLIHTCVCLADSLLFMLKFNSTSPGNESLSSRLSKKHFNMEILLLEKTSS